MTDSDKSQWVLVPRLALDELIEDVSAVARLCERMVYARLMGRVRAIRQAEREATDVVADAPDSAPDDTIGAERKRG